MASKVIPVRALVWLTIGEDGNVEEAELSGDISWMEPDPNMAGYYAPSHRTMSRQRVEDVIGSLVESDRWASVELTLEV